MEYRLAQTIVTVAGTMEFVTDRFDGSIERPKPGSTAATLTLNLRGDPSPDASREVVIGRGGADNDFAISQSADGRLTSITYKSVGAGGRVVQAGAKILAFVGGIVARVAPLFGAEGTPEDRRKADADRRAADEKRLADAERSARAEWDENHTVEASLYKSYVALVQDASKKVADARKAATNESDAQAGTAALAVASRLAEVITQSQSEIDRINVLYKAWRAATRTSRVEARSYDLALNELPETEGDTPSPENLGPAAKAAWESLGLIVGIGSGVGPASGTATPVGGGNIQRDAVDWRVPRIVRIWVWRRGPLDEPVLDRTFPALVVDEKSRMARIVMNATLFGEQSGELTFGELGVPSKIVRADKSAIGAFADALSGVPDAVVSGLDSATKAQASFTGLLDAEEERRLAGLKRRVDIMNKQLEEKGLNATADDFALQKRLQQQVAIADSQGKLEPPSELQALKEQLDTVETRAKLKDAEQKAALDSELASVRADITRLEERVRLQELQNK